jgi:hypothetical protein
MGSTLSQEPILLTHLNPNRLTLGVTGHRLLMDIARLRMGIDNALKEIIVCFGEKPFTLLSPLAEGADRLVVEQVLQWSGAQFVVVLPSPPSDRTHELEASYSQKSWLALYDQAVGVMVPPPAPSNAGSYERIGQFVLDHSDVLIAVWDGLEARGDGGTGDVVKGARARGLPLAWVKAGNHVPGTSTPTTLGSMQGAVSYERFPDQLKDRQ